MQQKRMHVTTTNVRIDATRAQAKTGRWWSLGGVRGVRAAPYREVVFCVRVVGDVHAKLSASPPWFLASDPGPCPPPSPPPLLSLPWPRRVPCPVSREPLGPLQCM